MSKAEYALIAVVMTLFILLFFIPVAEYIHQSIINSAACIDQPTTCKSSGLSPSGGRQ